MVEGIGINNKSSYKTTHYCLKVWGQQLVKKVIKSNSKDLFI